MYKERFSFRKAELSDKATIMSWLDARHMREFWDNSQAHRDDIEIFMNGRKEKSEYFGGIFSYWVGLIDDRPTALIMTHYESVFEEEDEPFISHVSKTGETIGLDFGIGETEFLGKGLSSLILKAFMTYYVTQVDSDVDTFMIDPLLRNPRAIHVYKKAGFKNVAEFIQEGGVFDQEKGVLMVKRYK